MSALPTHASALPRLDVDYTDAALPALLADDAVLAVFGFGPRAPVSEDPRYLRVALEPTGTAPLEVWRGHAPVRCGRDGAVAWSDDGALLFASMELDEDALAGDARDDDIERAAQAAYTRLSAFVAARGYPHLLRMWNYLDGITAGEGDAERYRRFCVGRAQGLGPFDPHALPAATAIGRVDGVRRLQVYLLAARVPGTPLENPRQVSAYRYPRQYGPQPPSFARAMLPPAGSAMPLLLSGTAAVVGHESRHADCVAAQLDETLANFDSLVAAARARAPHLPARFGAGTRLKVYVRDAAELPHVRDLLAARLDPAVQCVVLHAAICRRELRIEIDGVHG
ncbi:pteridine-dependent deoxygenase [Novilysobacter selenitireducens]|uniref:Pteridine-dependent deoxygenase n=1 Tax=Novilysobacter selenitireducens TaxID=2872639 RepID=A0ABS7T2F3_9GAMM|nr:pteridine-dependent deoxygenase [Lysobacter selenitireducens]MBZ4038049.1 pteridine-dependent deoxygenase [Lysobacter selenitireducens]